MDGIVYYTFSNVTPRHIAGGILLCVGGIGGYQYVSKLNNQLNNTALPNTKFEGISLAGKNKADIQSVTFCITVLFL